MGNSFNAGNSQTVNLKTDHLYSNGPPAFLKTIFSAWTNDFIFHPNNRVKASFNNLTLLDSTFIGYKTFHQSFTLPVNQLGSSNSSFLLESIAVPGAYNPQSLTLSFVQLYYPRTFNVNNEDSVYINIPNTILQNKKKLG
jgi:hypothetical protein